MRLRRSSEKRRYAASQRLGRIDANPHQIDAVMFALRRIPEGGCILADEVGLGKTIEAGLVIAQLLAEGADSWICSAAQDCETRDAGCATSTIPMDGTETGYGRRRTNAQSSSGHGER